MSIILPKDRRMVAFLGSSSAPVDTYMYSSVEQTAAVLAQTGWRVVNFGSSGYMSAVVSGATWGANQIALDEEQLGEMTQLIDCRSLVREGSLDDKLNIISQMDALIICPGGYGTLLEFCLVAQLLQQGKLDWIPVYVVGTGWKMSMQVFNDHGFKNGYLQQESAKYFRYIDFPVEAGRELCTTK